MNPIETIGLNVLSIIPANYKANVNVNTQIIIEFNTDLDKSTIVDCFALLEDTERCYIVGNNINFTKYKFVKGSVHYHDKVITFTPSEQLNKNSRYILYIKPNVVRDVFGKTLRNKFISIFDVESTPHDIKCDVILPTDNSIVGYLDKVELSPSLDTNAKYLIQIAKTSTFETTVYEEIENSNIVEKDFGIGDGLYYIRAKSLNGDYGNTVCFSVRTFINTTPVDDDVDEMFIYRPVIEDEVKLLEQFPTGINIKPQTNALYIKFKGIIPLEEIDFYESNLIGQLSDSDDADSITEHGEVDGSFVVVYDEEKILTYVFYIPTSI